MKYANLHNLFIPHFMNVTEQGLDCSNEQSSPFLLYTTSSLINLDRGIRTGQMKTLTLVDGIIEDFNKQGNKTYARLGVNLLKWERDCKNE